MNKLIRSQSLLTLSNTNIIFRNYAFKSDLKIKWVRPEKVLCIKPQKSGDLSPIPAIDKNAVVLDYQHSTELETANEHVQRLFTLGYNPRKKTTEYFEKSLVDTVKRHDLDLGSMESKLAKMTANIRSLQEYMEKYPRNKKQQVFLKELIDRRKKFLTYLKRWDYKKFEWILERLDLVYKAYPSYYHWITRKESLVKLTDIHCDNIRNERLDDYRNRLENEQEQFLEKKLKNLQFIRDEQEACFVPVTVTPEQIKEVQMQLDLLRVKKSSELNK